MYYTGKQLSEAHTFCGNFSGLYIVVLMYYTGKQLSEVHTFCGNFSGLYIVVLIHYTGNIVVLLGIDLV